MRRFITSAIAAVAVLTVTAACGSSDAGGSGEKAGGTAKVKVGAIPIVDVAPLHLGKEKGFFAEQGIDVEVVNTTGGAAAVPGVVSGEFDFAFGNLVSLIVARSNNLPLKAIAEGNSSTGQQGKDFGGVVVPKDSPIKSAAELSGKTVAVNNLKNIGDTTVRASIRKAGGDPTNVKFVELAFPDMPAAVAAKRVDAAWIVEPFFTVAQNQGARVIASNFVDTAPNLTISAYFTTEKNIKQNPDLVKRFTAAIEKSLKYAQEHPAEARAVLLKYTKIDPTVTEKITLPSWSGQINRESVQTMADLMLTDGLIKQKVDVSELLP
ncbi:NitT/TauT family transport system substrate-binding protein [Micromonospora rhizosphaerae]|uniref:NitT/TauT family transport system substrate-binding protein n=1 Tax=Micromonospora rhizosphaerae TaxID=568872 RepID=A0A1C6SVV2_9ACTN|nr:ABC transporter substrate-binding protein [Micromonospora rhizosphaerae]SCL33764.1 NitT/TauT family transport system substrate-binding protein [Micromonospora rhizosphaerae]